MISPPNKVAIAEIPESRFKELEIQKTPDWLKYYKTNENTVEWLYSRGYMYNGWEECEKALTYLEKANTQNPKFKGLQTELAYAYNALEKFDKAAIALKMAIEDNPKDCYSLKELAFTYCQLSYFDKSIEIYNKMASFCQEKQAVQESAFNLAAAYYRIKDKTKFDYWDKETRKWSTTPNIMTQYLDKYETDMK